MKASQPSDHQAYHGRINHRLTGFGQELIILAQSTILPQPGKGAFNNPAIRKHMEPFTFPPAPHNFQRTASVWLDPSHQRAGVAPIGPYPAQPGPRRPGLLQNPPSTLPIGNIRRMHHRHQDQAQGVHQQMPLPSFHLLADVIASRPPFSVVLTDWLSTMAASGSSWRPDATRT
jgi:hypothetical protein